MALKEQDLSDGGSHPSDETSSLLGNKSTTCYEGGIPEGDYEEKRKFIYCMQLRTGVIVFGIFLIIDYIIEMLNVFIIFFNPYFDLVFSIVYFILLFPLLAGVVIYCVYYIAGDSKKTRKWLPWAHLLALLTAVLVIVWICFYIAVLYPRNYIIVDHWDQEANPNVQELDTDRAAGKQKYTHQSKGSYILWHVLPPTVFAFAYVTFYFVTEGWVERHKN